MPRTAPDLNDPVQRQLAINTTIARELRQLTPAGRGRALAFIDSLVTDGETAAAELKAMKSIAYLLSRDEVTEVDRRRVAKRLREDYGDPETSGSVNASLPRTP